MPSKTNDEAIFLILPNPCEEICINQYLKRKNCLSNKVVHLESDKMAEVRFKTYIYDASHFPRY